MAHPIKSIKPINDNRYKRLAFYLTLDGGDDVIDSLERDGGATLFAGPVCPVLQGVHRQHVARLALEAEHGRHVRPHLSLVAAPRAEAVEEPVATDVLATTKVAL